MELTPKLLTDDVDFRIAFRGYDQDEVDDFLERVAEAVGQLLDQLNQAVERARSAENRLQKAQLAAATSKPTAGEAVDTSAPETPAVAPAAVAPDAEALAAAKAEERDLNEELRRTLLLAQRTADTAIAEAREEAAKIDAEAKQRAASLVADAENDAKRRRDEARESLVTEVDELERVREAVRADVGLLERHLGEQRARVRETVQVLRRIVDDPKSFEPVAAPPLSGVSLPAASSSDEGDATPAASSDDSAAAADDGHDAALGATADTDADAADEVRGASEPGAPREAAEADADDEAEAVASPGAAPAAPAASPPVPDTDLRARRTDASDAPPAVPPAAPRATAAPSAESARGDAPRHRAGAVETAAPRLDFRAPEPAPAVKPDVPAAPGESGFEPSARHDLRSLFGSDASAGGAPSSSAPGSWKASSSRFDQGPHTQPVAATRVEEEPDDAFLAELRKAMTEEEPLGPRDGIDAVPFAAPQPQPRTTRFGRRR